MLITHAMGGARPRVHFSGIGGTAMVAGARLALEAGWEVRGSDNPLYPPASEMAAALGVPIAQGYAAENLDWNPDVVVLGNALSRGNPEAEAALARGLHYVSLAEWVKDAVLRARRPVALCGTHGKTTTTALTAYLLDAAGLNPGFLIGGQPLDFAHSARLGAEGAPFVIEGDEYDTAFFDKRAKFFHYLPRIAVVTSLEFDHGDIYANVEEIEKAFRLMLRQIPRNGLLLVCADQPRALALREHAFSPVRTYGLAPDADYRAEPGPACAEGQTFSLHFEGRSLGLFTLPMAGRHNLQNAAAALAVAHAHGVEPASLADALARFRGVKRRMEVFHEADGVTFVDDFAHHPTAIRETIAAARARWADRRLWVLFEPRSNTTVTKRFQPDLEVSFDGADIVWFGPIHRAESIPEAERLDRAALAQALEQRGMQARAAANVDEILADLAARNAPGDVVLLLSNGAFGGIYARIREQFAVKG